MLKIALDVKLNGEQGWKEQRNTADLFKYLAT